jgi:hypothetical protein
VAAGDGARDALLGAVEHIAPRRGGDGRAARAQVSPLKYLLKVCKKSRIFA